MPGARLQIPVQQVAAADEALAVSLAAIQRATAEGARIFAPVEIGAAIEHRDMAVESRGLGAWAEVVTYADTATDYAGQALDISLAQRDRAAEAIVSDVQGDVEGRAPAEPGWSARTLRDVLVEFERVRTLSSSTAQVTFRDLSRLRLNANSNAIIQRMRSDPLTGAEVTEVSLVEGDFYALLNQLGDRAAFEIDVPGIETRTQSADFWIKHDAEASRFANYDQAALEITRGADTISLGENEGAVVPAGSGAAERARRARAHRAGHAARRRAALRRVGRARLAGRRGGRGLLDRGGGRPGLQRDAGVRMGGARHRPRRLGPGAGRVFLAGLGARPAGPARRAQPELALRAGGGRHAALPDAARAARGGDPRRARGRAGRARASRACGSPSTAAGCRWRRTGDSRRPSPPPSGPTRVTVEAVDAAGNRTERTRSFVHRPGGAIAIAIDPALARDRDGRLVTRADELDVAGASGAEAGSQVRVLDAGGAVAVQTLAAADGGFRFTVPASDAGAAYTIEIVAPGGAVEGRQDFVAMRDATPPAIALDAPPPRATAVAWLDLAGAAGDAAAVAVNGAAAEVADGRFAATVVLAPGPNVIEIVATDLAGNVGTTRLETVLDTEPPAILSAAAGRPAGADGPIEIAVEAEDASGLRQAAPFILTVGGVERRGFLRCDAGACRETLPPEPGELRLIEVAVEDYAGNVARRGD